jgi:S2P endopeptidase
MEWTAQRGLGRRFSCFRFYVFVTTDEFVSVEVGTFLPRFSFLPLWLPVTFQVFFEFVHSNFHDSILLIGIDRYLRMATLSLYFFNLLPLPFLDGAQFLNTILDMSFDSPVQSASIEEYDLEALETRTPPRRMMTETMSHWKYSLARVIPVTTAGIFVACTVLALLDLR